MAELAERAGVTERTVRKIEGGDLRVSIGTVFDCAALVGVPLFYDDDQRVASEAARERAVVMGRRVRSAEPEVDLDF